MAGHRSLRKREAHTSRGPSASEPRALHASRQLEKTVPSSAGNQLGQKKQWLEAGDRNIKTVDDQGCTSRGQVFGEHLHGFCVTHEACVCFLFIEPAVWVARLGISG